MCVVVGFRIGWWDVADFALSSAKKYGFLRSEGGKLVSGGSRPANPLSAACFRSSHRAPVLGAPDIAEVYSHYRGENLPDHEFFINALRDTFKIPAGKISAFLEVFFESMESAGLIDRSGEGARLIDVGRD